MGTSTDAHCYACGYDTFLLLGGGMSNHLTFAAWPVTCVQCNEITTANFKAEPLTCLRCGSEDVAPVVEEIIGNGGVAEQWGDLVLTDGRYKCPKCGKAELRFGTYAAGFRDVSWD